MSTAGKRARDKDRDAAIEVVEAAWADGQIVEADRDRRVEELRGAQTMAEVEMVTHDLRLPAGSAAYAPPDGPETVPAPASIPGKAQQPAVSLVALMVVMAVLGVGVAGVVAAVKAVSGSSDSATAGSSAVPLSNLDLLSPRGYRALVADVDTERGSTEAFEAVLYPGYAVLYLPADATSSRYELWYWAGFLDDLDSRNTTEDERFDLADVDPAVVVRLIRKVKRLVDEPTSWYAILRAPDPSDGRAITAYASNEHSESAFVSATVKGRIVFDSTTP